MPRRSCDSGDEQIGVFQGVGQLRVQGCSHLPRLEGGAPSHWQQFRSHGGEARCRPEHQPGALHPQLQAVWDRHDQAAALNQAHDGRQYNNTWPCTSCDCGSGALLLLRLQLLWWPGFWHGVPDLGGAAHAPVSMPMNKVMMHLYGCFVHVKSRNTRR